MKLKGLLVLIAVLCLIATASAAWSTVNTTASWLPKLYHSSVALSDGTIVIMGGDDSLGNATNNVWNSTDDGATWTLVDASAAWSGREHSTAVALPDDSIVLMGGETRIGLGGGTLNETWRSTDGGASWTQMNASSGWSKRSSASSVALSDGSIVLMGGTDNYVLYNDTWISHDNGATWVQQTANAEWTARTGQSAVIFSYGHIALMGGRDGDTSAYYKNDTWVSIDNGTVWDRYNASGGWLAREQQSSVALIDDWIVLMGGTGATNNNEWLSTNIGQEWSYVAALPWGSTLYGQSAVLNPVTRTVVVTGGHPAYSVYKNNFTPIVTSISPTNGSEAGGTTVTITGSGFTGAAVLGEPVYFGAINGVDSIIVSDTQIETTSPAGNGTVNVTISMLTGTSATSADDLFTYEAGPPIVTGISPAYGTESGGTVVNITGSGLTGATSVYLSVKFGTIPGSGTVFISDTEISSVSPPGTGSVHITVETPNGTSAATTADLFTYGAAPPSQNTWWTPHTVQVTVFDANYGTRLYDVGIQAHYNETSMPSNWITDLYGVGSTVRADMVNQTLIMNGNTGSAGTVTFTMLGSIKYDFTLNSAQYGISDYTVMEWPSDNMLDIYVLTAGSLLPTQRNSTYTNLNGTRVYFTEPDINNVSMCIDYIDTSGETSSVTFLWKFTNGTIRNTTTITPGTGLNTICNVTRNIRGTQIYWGFNATRSVVTV